MQPDRAVSFFLEEVEPTVAEFLTDDGSIRRGRLAAIMLAHMADHLFHARPPERAGCVNENAFRNALANANADFALICDVNNASKHAVLTLEPKGRDRLITRASQVILDYGPANSSEPANSGNPVNAGEVWVELDGGTYRLLEHAIILVTAMWRERLGL